MKTNTCVCMSDREESNLLVDMMMNPSSYNDYYLKTKLDICVYNQIKRMGAITEVGMCAETNDMCEIFDTEKMGKGVRALTYIHEGTLIGCYLGKLCRNKDVLPGRDWRYDYAYGLKGWFIDASDKLCEMAMVNHSRKKVNVAVEYEVHGVPYEEYSEPDCEVVECHIAFRARKDIEKGTELFIDYGDDYWRFAKKMGCLEYEDGYEFTDDEMSIEECNWDDIDEDQCHTADLIEKVSLDVAQKKITDYFSIVK